MMTVDPTLQPVITLTEAPSQFRETDAELFQPSTVSLSFRVDYGEIIDPNAKGRKLASVLSDMRDQNYQIYVGRCLALGGVPSPSPLIPFGSMIDASWSFNELATAGVPPIVRRISGAIVPGSRLVWQVDVMLSLVGYQTVYNRPHATVTTTSSVRMAAAYRLGTGLKFLTEQTAQPKLGEPTQGEVFTTGNCGTGSNARVGTYDSSNWLTYVKSTMDIGGQKVDIGGQPISVPIEQLHYTLQFVIRKPNFGEDIIPGGPAAPTDYGQRYVGCMWELWGQYPQWALNKRNASTLFGYVPGSLVVTNVTNTPIDDEFVICNVTLTWDEWGHCEQAPWSFQGNMPPTIEAGAGDRKILNADTVYWINPHQECFNWASTDFPYEAYDLFSESILVPTFP